MTPLTFTTKVNLLRSLIFTISPPFYVGELLWDLPASFPTRRVDGGVAQPSIFHLEVFVGILHFLSAYLYDFHFHLLIILYKLHVCLTLA